MTNNEIKAIINTIDNETTMEAFLSVINGIKEFKSKNESKNESENKYIICVEIVNPETGETEFHPFVTGSMENPTMIICDNAVEAQDIADSYSWIVAETYILPVTDNQITKLYDLLHEFINQITETVKECVANLPNLSKCDKERLTSTYLIEFMNACNHVAGSSLNINSEINK